MATDKTPVHKRISRAEKSAAEWKMKAIERREAAEALKEQLTTASENIQIKNAELDDANKRRATQEKQIAELTKQLEQANRTISRLQTEANEHKKKVSR
jgi:predicted  nucleic acid-binding Zn-ribbon protein